MEEENNLDLTALVYAIVSERSANVVALIELGAQWLRYGAFFYASIARDPKIAEILLKKISTSTMEEQQHAASIIDRMTEDTGKNVFSDWAKEWRRKQQVSGFRR